MAVACDSIECRAQRLGVGEIADDTVDVDEHVLLLCWFARLRPVRFGQGLRLRCRVRYPGEHCWWAGGTRIAFVYDAGGIRRGSRCRKYALKGRAPSV